MTRDSLEQVGAVRGSRRLGSDRREVERGFAAGQNQRRCDPARQA
jgi:hypothetical protein